MSIPAQRLDYMNVARGFAILMVIFVHTAQAIPGLSFYTSVVSQYGQFGVQLFFVASAYTLSLSSEARSNDSKPLLFFYIRRFFRIAPLYYVASFVYFLFFTLKKFYLEGTVSSFEPYTFFNVMANVLLIHGFVPSANNNIVPGGWSIGTEMAFYWIFPFLFAFLKSGMVGSLKKVVAVIMFSFFINIIFQLFASRYTSIGLDKSDFFYFNIVNQIPTFLFGILIYFFCRNEKEKEARASSIYLVALWLAFSALALYVLNLDNFLMRAIVPTISGISFSFFVLFLKKVNASNHLLSRIGIRSFSMYIFHFIFAWGAIPVISKKLNKVMNPDLTLGLSFLIVVALTYFVAAITEKHIEKTGISLGKRLIDSDNRRNGMKEA